MAVVTKMQSALIGGHNNGEILLTTSAPMPPQLLQDNEIAIAVKAISLNPVDTKMTGDYHTPGTVLGCDYAGEVTAVGSVAAKKWGYKQGDRVVAMVIGMNSLRPSVGAFAEHSISLAWGALKIPTDWSYAEGVGSIGGLAWITVPWALFHAMGLPAGPELEPMHSLLPPPKMAPQLNIVTAHTNDGTQRNTAVLVSGAASYTGTCAVQVLKLAGYTVIATCSSRSFDKVRSFGADAVYDYASPTAAEEIKAYTRNSLRLSIDCITTPDTTTLCYAAMGRAGGRYVSLDPSSESITVSRAVVRPSWVFGLEPLGEEIPWPAPHSRAANPVAQQFLEAWNPTMQGLLKRGLVKPYPNTIYDTGLAGALEGLEAIRSKKVVGQKLIYNL